MNDMLKKHLFRTDPMKYPYNKNHPMKWELHNTKECQIEKNSASENSDFIGVERDAF